MSIPNDSPCLADSLGHLHLVKVLGDRLIDCQPPYVVGVGGSWGSGKTSFLHKLWAYIGGKPTLASEQTNRDWALERIELFKPLTVPLRQAMPLDERDGLHLIWFNPWHHQFEASPLVALLHEIRDHLAVVYKAGEEARKVGNVVLLTALNMLGDMTKLLRIETAVPSVKTDEIVKRGKDWEDSNFHTALASERFRTVFEKTIAQIIGDNGRLVIFIDDLDRCEKATAFKLLEELKLYLTAKNCVFVLGLDRDHLETLVAKNLERDEPAAREYLSKLFQMFFVLPRPTMLDDYIETLLDWENDLAFRDLLQSRCKLALGVKVERDELVRVLNDNLPHNPRKVKSFVLSWKLYLEALALKEPTGDLDWKLTIILHYLGQFEEPLLRKLEDSTGFYNTIVDFARKTKTLEPRLQGLEVPFGEPPLDEATPTTTGSETAVKTIGRPFYIARLIREMSKAGTMLVTPDAELKRHIPWTGTRRMEH